MYQDIDPADGFKQSGIPFPDMSEKDKEDARKIYGMVSNIDDNLGRLLRHLEHLDIAENTVIIFMTDNGPQQNRYKGGMRGLKGSVYRGGIRVPFYFSYSGFDHNRDIETAAAHIDILPTIADLCNVDLPKYTKVDGQSLLPLMDPSEAAWQDRYLFSYWTRRFPELYNNISIQKGDYKLVGHTSYDSDIQSFELYDIINDPYEQKKRHHGTKINCPDV